MAEFVVFGLRKGRKEYLEGNILIQPVHIQVVKLYRNGDLDTSIFGVHMGEIDNFWGFGVHAFYGIDGCLYILPISRWGETEGIWDVYFVQGGWRMDDLSGDTELDETEFEGIK